MRQGCHAKADVTYRNISPLFSELFEKSKCCGFIYQSVSVLVHHVGLFANLRQMEIITSKKELIVYVDFSRSWVIYFREKILSLFDLKTLNEILEVFCILRQ